MEFSYVGMMIGFPVLLTFALAVLGIRYHFMRQEMREIRTRDEMEMSEVGEDALDRLRAREIRILGH